MPIKTILAQVNCSDFKVSVDWYEKLFGREPDAVPMDGLAEWHHGEMAGLQLFLDPTKAGSQTLTLIVSELRHHHSMFTGKGLNPGAIERGDTVSLVRLNDPDGNLVVLAQPGNI